MSKNKIKAVISNAVKEKITPDKIVYDKKDILNETNKNLIIKLLPKDSDPNEDGTFYYYNTEKEKWVPITYDNPEKRSSHIHLNKYVLDQFDWSTNELGLDTNVITVKNDNGTPKIGLSKLKEGVPKPETSETQILISENGEIKWSDSLIPTNIIKTYSKQITEDYTITIPDTINMEYDIVLAFVESLFYGQITSENIIQNEQETLIKFNSERIEIGDNVTIVIIKNTANGFTTQLAEMENKVNYLIEKFENKINSLIFEIEYLKKQLEKYKQ